MLKSLLSVFFAALCVYMHKKYIFLSQNWSVSILAFTNHKLYLLFVIFTIQEILPTLSIHMILINNSEKMWVVSFTKK